MKMEVIDKSNERNINMNMKILLFQQINFQMFEYRLIQFFCIKYMLIMFADP